LSGLLSMTRAAHSPGEAIALSSLTSTVALIVLFGSGFVATAGQHISHQYLVIAGVALFLIALVLAAVLAVGARPAIAGRAGSWAAGVARRCWPSSATGSRTAGSRSFPAPWPISGSGCVRGPTASRSPRPHRARQDERIHEFLSVHSFRRYHDR
jgi:hypothetical protein